MVNLRVRTYTAVLYYYLDPGTVHGYNVPSNVPPGTVSGGPTLLIRTYQFVKHIHINGEGSFLIPSL